MISKRVVMTLAIFVLLSMTPLYSAIAADSTPATERIFHVLNFDAPGLEKVKELHEEGKNDAAREELVLYLRRQNWAERAPAYMDIPEDKNPHYSDPIADDLLTNVFTLGPSKVYFGPNVSDITWYEPPMDQIEDKHFYYASHSLNRQDAWVPYLSKAYWHTGEEKYARKLVEILSDFIESCPVVDGYQIGDNQNYATAVDEDGDGKPDRPGSAVGMVWKPFVTGRRVQQWENLFVYCIDSKSFAPEMWCRILVSIDEQVDTLAKKVPHMSNRSNHTTGMGAALLNIADFWPFLTAAQDWRKLAIAKLAKTYNWFKKGGFIYPDGASTEIRVSVYMVQAVADVVETARKHDIEVPEHMPALLQAMGDFAFGLIWPDDFACGKYTELGRTLDALEGRKDLLFIATGGKEGSKPDFVSWPPKTGTPSYAGTYFMRSAWTPDAKVLRTRYGPVRYSSPGRGSSSMGEVSVFANGMFLIPFISRSVFHGEFTTYGNATFKGDGRSRNTIAVDGFGQTRYGRISVARKPMGNSWITNPVFDYLRGSYTFDPEKYNGAKITHTRSILFARSDYYLVIDRINASDEKEHEYRMKYQLAEQLEPQTNGIRVTAQCDTAGIVVESLSDRMHLDIITGQKEPYYEGWDPASDFKAAPALIYTWRDSGATGCETLLYPYTPDSKTPAIQITAEHAKDRSVCITVKGHHRDTVDSILISGDNGVCSGNGFTLRGLLGYVRTANGKPTSAGIVEGTSLQGPTEIFHFDKPESAYTEDPAK